jgi:arsenite-transporting ATPase
VLLMEPYPLLDPATRVLFFTGKGGMGKTTLACATAVGLAARGRRVLLVSTDPASNLDEVLETTLGEEPRPVGGIGGLDAANVDPEAAAREYRERLVGPYRGVLPEAALRSMEESLSGACTVEIAAFDAFTRLLADADATSAYDNVIFDTAPTGHTLRLLSLPAAWTEFIDQNTTGTSCLGPLAGLERQRAVYAESVATLTDPERTTLVLVARPEPSALAEAARTAAELADAGMRRQVLALNGVFTPADAHDPTAQALARQQAQALGEIPAPLLSVDRVTVPLHGFAPLGVTALAAVLDAGRAPDDAPDDSESRVAEAPLTDLVDELEAGGPGVIMTMGKGGVGKTTIAAAVAVELARRGHRVHLSTTDPAAHVQATVAEGLDGLMVSRIDPDAEARAYTAQVMREAGEGLAAAGRALLEEDLRSPCTEEIAVFRAFARTVADGEDGFVVLDTAPTGHTLLLLDAAEAYHREVGRSHAEIPRDVRELLPRLRDPDYTRVVIVTLPEATPVHEAERLAADLGRAGITPFAWIVNQSLALAGVTDPTLRARARREHALIDEVRSGAEHLAIVPWRAGHLSGVRALEALTAV